MATENIIESVHNTLEFVHMIFFLPFVFSVKHFVLLSLYSFFFLLYISFTFMCKIAAFPCDVMKRVRSNLGWSNMHFFIFIVLVDYILSLPIYHFTFRADTKANLLHFYKSFIENVALAHKTKGLDEHEKSKHKNRNFWLFILLLKAWN